MFNRNAAGTLIGGLLEPSYTPALTGGATYYWQVMARNAGGATPPDLVFHHVGRPVAFRAGQPQSSGCRLGRADRHLPFVERFGERHVLRHRVRPGEPAGGRRIRHAADVLCAPCAHVRQAGLLAGHYFDVWKTVTGSTGDLGYTMDKRTLTQLPGRIDYMFVPLGNPHIGVQMFSVVKTVLSDHHLLMADYIIN